MTYDPLRGRAVMFGGYGTAELGDTWTLGYRLIATGDACYSNIDYDGDGKIGCADPMCWPVCTPTCPPWVTSAACLATPSCGDGTCSGIEDCRSCPMDCATNTAACPLICGDGYCDTGETMTTCPGDCTP